MGGCRCTYRNCTAKSDGKVHMFHYPVFERVRCHQWLLNANRLEFLNLRVSQLKNRVVCQHHFKEDKFMNYKKDKLTFDAIPTEDGPYCDSSVWIKQPKYEAKMCPIILEDIENDCCTAYDKKANYSLRYGDFLTNSEVMDFDGNDICNKISLSNENKNSNLRTDHIINEIDEDTIIKNEQIYSDNLNLCLPLQDANKTYTQSNLQLPQPTLKVEPYSINNFTSTTNQNVNNDKKVAPKIKIISEKKIKEPIKIRGSFRKVSPSIVLLPPNKNNVNNKNNEQKEVHTETNASLNNISFDKSYVVQVEYEPPQVHNKNNSNTNQTVYNTGSISPKLPQPPAISDTSNIDKLSRVSPESKVSQLKNKLTPERMAAINSKREFNMKLRNIIEACLDTKEAPKISKDEDINKEILKPITVKAEDQKQIPVKSFPVVPAKEVPAKLPNIQDQTIAYLEARMQKMENKLINRIDENTKQITSLKESITKGNLKKKDSGSQTNENEESYKKFLYQEISKFLSPSSNSTIYEELFINKYALSQENSGYRCKRSRRS